jgi:hypothetical protein
VVTTRFEQTNSCEICDDMDRKSCYSSQGKLPILDQDSPWCYT